MEYLGVVVHEAEELAGEELERALGAGGGAGGGREHLGAGVRGTWDGSWSNWLIGYVGWNTWVRELENTNKDN